MWADITEHCACYIQGKEDHVADCILLTMWKGKVLKVIAEPGEVNEGPLVIAWGPNLSCMTCANTGKIQEQIFKVRVHCPLHNGWSQEPAESTIFSISQHYPLLCCVVVSETFCTSLTKWWCAAGKYVWIGNGFIISQEIWGFDVFSHPTPVGKTISNIFISKKEKSCLRWLKKKNCLLYFFIIFNLSLVDNRVSHC